jgi:hypothetical protein
MSQYWKQIVAFRKDLIDLFLDEKLFHWHGVTILAVPWHVEIFHWFQPNPTTIDMFVNQNYSVALSFVSSVASSPSTNKNKIPVYTKETQESK